MSENYMNPSELRAIADFCESFTPVWKALTSGPRGGIALEQQGEIAFTVYDSNGDTLGTIMWGDSGAAFYPTEQ